MCVFIVQSPRETGGFHGDHSQGAAGIAAAGLVSCVKVPANETGPSAVRFNEVVKRVKCDVVYAIKDKAKDPRLSFLSRWSAKVHMSLTVDDTATVNPGVSVVSPLSAAGTTFTFGAGGSFSGQATRQEDYEFFLPFTLAISDLSDDQNRVGLYDGCNFPPGLLLESNFDIGSIIDRAVSPIEAGTLYPAAGLVGSGSTAPARPADEAAKIAKDLEALNKIPPIQTSPQLVLAAAKDTTTRSKLETAFIRLLPQAQIAEEHKTPEQKAAEAEAIAKAQALALAIANAPKLERDAQLIMDRAVTPIYQIASDIGLPATCLKEMLDSRITATGKVAVVTFNRVKIDDLVAKIDPHGQGQDEIPDEIIKLFNLERDAKEAVAQAAQAMLDTLKKCKVPAPKPVAQPLCDPIDLIQETINFYITTSGNITPAWKLVRITAQTDHVTPVA